MSLGFRKAFGGSARGRNSKAMISSTAASVPTTSGGSGPWPPAWPASAAPGCGGPGNGGDRCGNDGRVGFGMARDVGAPLLWGRPAGAIDGEAGRHAAPPSNGASRERGLSALCGAEARPAVRTRWPVVRRCGLTVGRAASPETAGTDAMAALWVSRCASATAFDATAAACLVATSRLFVATSSVFVESTGGTAAGACGTMAVAWATAASTCCAICAVPNGSAACAVAGMTSPQAIAPPRAHPRTNRVFRPRRAGETSGLPSTGRK